MKKWSIILSLLLVVSLVMMGFGCKAKESVPPEWPVPLPPEEARKDVSVSGSLIVHLKSEPATGFKWELVTITDETVLVEVDHKYVGPAAEAPEEPDDKEEPVPPKEEWWTLKARSSKARALYLWSTASLGRAARRQPGHLFWP